MAMGTSNVVTLLASERLNVERQDTHWFTGTHIHLLNLPLIRNPVRPPSLYNRYRNLQNPD